MIAFFLQVAGTFCFCCIICFVLFAWVFQRLVFLIEKFIDGSRKTEHLLWTLHSSVAFTHTQKSLFSCFSFVFFFVFVFYFLFFLLLCFVFVRSFFTSKLWFSMSYCCACFKRKSQKFQLGKKSGGDKEKKALKEMWCDRWRKGHVIALKKWSCDR